MDKVYLLTWSTFLMLTCGLDLNKNTQQLTLQILDIRDLLWSIYLTHIHENTILVKRKEFYRLEWFLLNKSILNKYNMKTDLKKKFKDTILYRFKIMDSPCS